MHEREKEIDRAYRKAKRAAFWADVRQMRWWQYLAVSSVAILGAVAIYALVSITFFPRKPAKCDTVEAVAIREGWAISTKSFAATTRSITVRFDNGAILLAEPRFVGDISYPARVKVEVCMIGLPTVTGLADEP